MNRRTLIARTIKRGSRCVACAQPVRCYGGSRNDYGGSRNDYGGSRNDYGGSRNDYGGSRNDYGGSRNDYGSERSAAAGVPVILSR